jgi:hypothetical protein
MLNQQPRRKKKSLKKKYKKQKKRKKQIEMDNGHKLQDTLIKQSCR